MARNAATVDIGINVPASEIRKAEQQLGALFNKAQAFNKNPIVSKNYTQPLGRITGAANEFNKSLAASNARVIAFGASAGAIFAVQKAMSELVKTTIQVEQQLKNIEVLLGATDKEFRRFSDGLFKTAQATGKSFADVAASAEEFARQGLNVEATLKRNNAAMVLSKLGAMDVKNATESLTAAINTFGKSAGDATTIVNKLAQVDAKFAVSSGDLAEAIKRSGAAAVSANVEFEQFISVVTLAQERTARGGAVIGNSFKTIFTRLQRNETLRELEKLGVATRNLSTGELLPAMTILKNYAKVYETLAPTVKASTAQMLAGVFQVNVLKSVLPELASEYGRYNQALNVANNTTNEATERMKELTSTTQGMLNKTMVNLTKFASEVGNLTIKPALERILKLMNGFADLIGPENFFGLGETIGTAVYKGMGKIIEGPGLMLLGVVIAKIAGRLGGYVKDAAAGFMGIQTQSQRLADTQSIIQNLLANRPGLINQATASEEGMVAVARVLAQKLKESSMEMERLTQAAQRAAPAVLAMQGGAKSAGGKKIGAKGFVPGFASGFVPNFNMATQERRMASAGGYQAGKIREATLPGVGRVTYNGNEKIKQFPGLEQPGIMPPALSPAGKNYRESFRSVHGFDPYNSAGGFVPNFAAQSYMIGGKQYSGQQVYAMLKPNRKKPREFTAEQAAAAGYRPSGTSPAQRAAGVTRQNYTTGKDVTRRDPAYTHPFDVGGRIGILGFSGMMNRKATASMFIKDLSAMNEVVAMNPALGNDKIQFNNVQVSSVSGLAKEAKAGGKPFFEKISDFLAKPLADLTQYFSESVLGNQGKLNTASITKQLKGRNALLPPGAEGDIFEAVVKILTTEPKHLRRAFDAKRDFKAPFDFEEVGRATPKFRQTFGYTSRLERADAKRSATQDTVNTVVKKGINWALLNPSASFAKAMQGAPGMSKDSAITPKGAGGKAGYHTADTRTAASMRVGNLGSALGFVPNFAAVGSRMGSKEAMKRSQATVSAMDREHRAGVPRNQIRVGFDKRIAGGVGVFNTSETSLGNAINMHMARGASMKDIQTMGAAGGFVPNFIRTIGEEAAWQGINLNSADTNNRTGGGPNFVTSRGPSVAGPASQATAQINSAANTFNEGSMMMSMAMMMAGSQLSVFGSSLQESESATKRVAGEFLSLAGTFAMYYPVLSMATASYGGLNGALAAATGRLATFAGAATTSTVSFVANTKAVLASTIAHTKAAVSSAFAGGRAGGIRGFLTGGRSSAQGVRGGFMNSYGFARGNKVGFLGSTQAGLASVGKTTGGIVGAGARGGAALLGSTGAMVGAGALAAYGGYKAYQSVADSKVNEAIKDFDKLTRETTESLKMMDSALKKAGEAAGDLEKAQRMGRDTTGARTSLVGAMSNTGIRDMIRREGGLDVEGKGRMSHKAVLTALGDANTDSSQVNEIMQAANKLKAKYERASQDIEGIGSVLKTIKENQSFWGSTKTTAADITKFGTSLASVFSEVSSGEAKKLNRTVRDLREGFEDIQDWGYVSTGELKKYTKQLSEFIADAPIEKKARDILVDQIDGLANQTNLNEEDLAEFYEKALKPLEDQLTGLSNAAGFIAKKTKSLKIDRLHKAVLELDGEFKDLARQLVLDKSISQIFQDEAVKMFDIGTQTLQTALGKTASELTKIEITQRLATQRVDLQGQDRMRKIQEEGQQQIMEAVKKVMLPKTKSTEAQAGVFPDFETFDAIVGKNLAGQMQKAIADADFAGAQQLIQNAISNQGTLTTAGGGVSGGAPLADLLDETYRSLQEMEKVQNDKIKIEQERIASEKRVIAAQRKAAEQLNKLSQQIEFAGGLGGAGGSPAAAADRTLKARLDMAQGFGASASPLGGGGLTAGRDVFMKGMIEQIKVLKSLTDPGGFNPANAYVDPLTDEIERNLKGFLKKIGVDESNFTDLRETARKQAENLIKPDMDIADLVEQQQKFKFDGDALKVFVVNPEREKETKEQKEKREEHQKQQTELQRQEKIVKDLEAEQARRNREIEENKAPIPVPPMPMLKPNEGPFRLDMNPFVNPPAGGRGADIVRELLNLPKGEQKDTIPKELRDYLQSLNMGPPEGSAPPQKPDKELGDLLIKQQPKLTVDTRTGKTYLDMGQGKRKELTNEQASAVHRQMQDHAKRVEKHNEEEVARQGRLVIARERKEQIPAELAKEKDKLETMRRKNAEEFDARRTSANAVVDEMYKRVGGTAGGEEASKKMSYARRVQDEYDRIATDGITPSELENFKKFEQNLRPEFTQLSAQAAKAEAVAAEMKDKAPTKQLTPGQAAQQELGIDFKPNVDAFTRMKQAASGLLKSQLDFPGAYKITQEGIKTLEERLMGVGSEAEMFSNLPLGDKIRLYKKELMLLNDEANMEAFRNGRKDLKSVREALLSTMDTLIGEDAGAALSVQLKQLNELENARINEARASQKTQSSSQFIREASDEIIKIGKDFHAVGIAADEADEDIRKLKELRDSLAQGGMTEEEMKKFSDAVEKVGLKAEEARRKLGLVSPEEFIEKFLKVWSNGQKRTVEITKKALSDLYKGLGDVDVDPEQRKKELGEKFAQVISGAVKDMSSEMEGQALSSAQEYFRLTGDQAKATQKLNQLDQERIFLFDMVSEGIITEAEAQRLFAQEVRNATAETDKLSRELGYIDAKEFKERFIKRIQEGIQDGSVTAGEGIRRTFKQIGDLAINADLRESEIRKGLGTSISNAIATLSSDAIGENMNISTELYKVTGDLNLAQRQAINLDKTRVKLFRKLRRGSITLAEALEKMGEAQDKAAKRVDTNKRKRGQLSESEFIERESIRFNNALKRSRTDTGGALEDYFASITDLGGVFDATKAREAKTQSAKSIGELLKKTVTEASAEAQSLANQLAGFERSGVAGMANKAAEETLKIRQKQKQVEMEFAAGLISRVEADQKLAEINREATDRVTKLAMAVGTLSDEAGKSKLLDSRKADLNQRGLLDDPLFNQNRREQFGLDQTFFQRFRNTEVGMGGMMMDRDADLSKNAISAERDLVKQRFEQTGDYNNALSLATDLEKRRMEILAEGAKNGESLIEIERQLNFARMDTAAKGLGQALQNGSITADQYRQNIGALSEDLMNGSLEAADKTKVWKMELGALFALDKNYGFKQLVAGTKDVFMTLREGIKGALKDVITGAKSMREALQGVFAAIADKMLDRTIGSLVDTIFYALMPRPYGMYNKGGQVKGYNGGGIVRGGSGVRDDVPAVLTRGEYVVRKKAVNKYGRGFIEQLNQGRIKKYADGGSASFSLMNQFDYNDPKRPTAGTMNVDSRMSAFAQTDTNNPMNQLKFDKEKTLDSYLKEKAQYEEQKRQAMANYKKQRRGLIRSMFIQIGMMSLTYGINKAIANAKLEKAALAKSKVSPLTGLRAGEEGPMTEIHTNKVEAFKADMGRIFGSGSKMDYGLAGFKALGNENVSGFLGSIAKGVNPYVAGAVNDIPTGSGGFSPKQVHTAGRAGVPLPVQMKEINWTEQSKGGPMMGGRDNIPALLTGGEYVVNKQSVNKYGLDFFNKLNAGRLPGFNSGGLVGENNGPTRMTDGGGAPSNVNNNITINVTVEKDGNVSTDTTNEQAGGNQNTQGALNEEERNKQFSGAIKDAVVREIVEQKRPGGLLYNEKRSGT